MRCRCKHRCSTDRVKCGIEGSRAERQSSNGSNMWRRNATTIAFSAAVRTVDRGFDGPVFISSTVARLRHVATVSGLMPSSRLSCASPQTRPWTDGGRSSTCDRCIAARTACVVEALPGRTCPMGHPSNPKKGSHHQTAGSNTVRGPAFTGPFANIRRPSQLFARSADWPAKQHWRLRRWVRLVST